MLAPRTPCGVRVVPVGKLGTSYEVRICSRTRIRGWLGLAAPRMRGGTACWWIGHLVWGARCQCGTDPTDAVQAQFVRS